jgi:hypothetical protein
MTELDSGPAHQPPAPAFVNEEHDARDPNQWLTLYLDVSVSINETVKHAWLHDSSTWSRQQPPPVGAADDVTRGRSVGLTRAQHGDAACDVSPAQARPKASESSP